MFSRFVFLSSAVCFLTNARAQRMNSKPLPNMTYPYSCHMSHISLSLVTHYPVTGTNCDFLSNLKPISQSPACFGFGCHGINRIMSSTRFVLGKPSLSNSPARVSQTSSLQRGLAWGHQQQRAARPPCRRLAGYMMQQRTSFIVD